MKTASELIEAFHKYSEDDDLPLCSSPNKKVPSDIKAGMALWLVQTTGQVPGAVDFVSSDPGALNLFQNAIATLDSELISVVA